MHAPAAWYRVQNESCWLALAVSCNGDVVLKQTMHKHPAFTCAHIGVSSLFILPLFQLVDHWQDTLCWVENTREKVKNEQDVAPIVLSNGV
jgi:hypothetical protein